MSKRRLEQGGWSFMVARAWERVEGRSAGRRAGSSTSTRSAPRAASAGVEEMFVQNETVSLCLLLNRRTKTMRVIDFRAGPSYAKRLFVLELAQREGIEKVYTLVERDEVGTWLKLGFEKEANIPGVYKRSDAFILGCGADAESLAAEPRLRDDDDDDDSAVGQPSAAHDRLEKLLVQAKKLAKELHDRSLPQTKIAPVKVVDVKKAVEKQLKAGRALTAFEPFGRDVERRWFQLTARGGFELFASTEAQSCFGNAFLELLTAPQNDAERLATAAALRTLCDKLMAEGVVSCFSMAPSDDVALATAFVWNGFRRTGLVKNHIVVGRARKDAVVWSRKLANPADD
jgi:hypothetical protein